VKEKVLLQKIDIVFDEFHNIILECEDRKADKIEVFQVVTMYQNLGYLLDGVFSIARTPYGEMNEEKCQLMDRTVNALMKMWRYLRLSMKGPKIHGVEDHLRDQMNEIGGIGDYLEDFVEQGHQTGVKDEIRTKGLNRMKAFIAHLNWEFRNNRVGVFLAKEVKRKTGRKRKRNANTRRIESKISRETKQLKSIEDVESGKYSLIDDYRGKGGIRRTRE
jgi:Rad3-related DNA helicase